MKILSAKFENFRLLRDLEIDFSDALDKRLTVIRAANESGKTTMLIALQWALYGDTALPGKGRGFRLSPLDAKDKNIQITVTVEFEVTRHNKTASGERKTKKKYKILRSAQELHDDFAAREPSIAQLYEINDNGFNPIDNPDQVIRDELPPELREVFFTDGDRALSFIDVDTDESEKRKRVESAIRSLLGLEIIEKAIAHVKKAEGKLNTKIKKSGAGGKLGNITSRLEDIEDLISREEENLGNADESFSNFGEKLEGISKAIEENLKKGNQEQLAGELARIKKLRGELSDRSRNAERNHSYLFRDHILANSLVTTSLQSVFIELDELYDQKKIPRETIPVLQERLERGICICGEKLDSGDEATQHRIKHIRELIKASEGSDKFQKIITKLYYDTLEQRNKGISQQWWKQYEEISNTRENLLEEDESAGRNQTDIERKIDSLGNVNIAELKKTQASYQKKREEAIQKQTEARTKLSSLKEQKANLIEQRDELLKQKNKNDIFLAERDVISDVLGVFEGAFNQIKKEELDKVSNGMNSLFLEMIGHDPEQESLATIRRSEISPEFDILVYGGPDNKPLNPDVDLNGASRRALTLAFILALSKVSEVVAPNIIDTPLATTSGEVRRAILKAAIRESKQLILFLTHDEIRGCEDIIDEEADTVFTLTNSGHYPTMLANDSGVDEAKVLRCRCNHREACEICKRKNYNVA
ncbi:MAG: AAA family ATPase [Hyphomicrobiales bacterium]|nr:AAA family ATPase [Hyphomicrobiales bacterium]